MTTTDRTRPAWLAIVEQIDTPVAPVDRYDLLDMASRDMRARGMSSGEVSVAVIAGVTRTIYRAAVADVDLAWRQRVATMLVEVADAIAYGGVDW